jgi:hypothetical protein
MRLMTWMVIAKSGTSLERAMKSSRKMTLLAQTGQQAVDHREASVTYQIILSIIQQSPSIHPVVTSLRTVRQLRRESAVTSLPATRVVNRIKAAATA